VKQTLARKNFLFFSLIILIGCAVLPSKASALTISEVVVDLACPCECPLVLEDCNMSCGLKWKNEVGELINQGMTKKQIIGYFVDKHGEAALLTPMQRVHGKIFQYTRSFDAIDWTLLWTGIAVWVSLMFFGIYIGIRKLFFKSSQSA
jgi:cytochrome c-type biogenesis protein CcmH/NrfF